ncbi:MAG: Sb-PDE family phosphodiesterase [Verrucomicrobiae bacterium]|nr:Sb-PDE family phosphodiesterase [Verrucomicrobiae bacterium]
MKPALVILLGMGLLCAPGQVGAHEPVTRARTEIRLPNLPGLLTLKCDFHIHTVFSDGLVWPTVRSEEAWREGLDAIAITDHIEYQPHKADVSTNHNRAYDIAKPAGEALELMVIRGSEITRRMPPGHLNAIFLTNSTPLATSNWLDAVAAAHAQGAFIFWNHPGWEAQTTNGLVLWYPEHTQLLERGMLHGIEVVNGRSYYPEAHRWAIEKNLAMISNSDIHAPLNLDYHVHDGDLRPVTLVFAAERTPAALKKALFARQTAVLAMNRLIGDEKFLRPLFERSLRFNKPQYEIRGRGRALAQIANDSSVDFVLERTGQIPELILPPKLVLPAMKTVLLEMRASTNIVKGTHRLKLPYQVSNVLVGPAQPLQDALTVEIKFTPTSAK